MKTIDDNTVIVLDTNILNHIFTQQITDGEVILALLKKYKKNLWIPYTVLSEFRKNDFAELENTRKKDFSRFSTNICNEYDNFIQKMKKLQNECKSKGFFDWDEYLSSKVSSIDEKIKEEKTSVKAIKSTEYIDKLHVLIEEVNGLLDELCNSNQVGKEFTVKAMIDICEEGSVRYAGCIPPGYSDDGKKEGYSKYNDLFIWKEIINLAITTEPSKIIFLTDDMKEGNWWIHAKDDEKREMSPFLKKEFYEMCPSDYANKFHVELVFQTLSDFISGYKMYNISLIRINKDKILDKLKHMYSNSIIAEFESFLFNLDPMDIDDLFSYPNNAGEIFNDDPVFESENIEEIAGGFNCKMAVSQIFYYTVAYEDNEGDTFALGDAEIQMRASVEINSKIEDEDISQVFSLEQEDCELKIEHISYEVLSCRTIYD